MKLKYKYLTICCILYLSVQSQTTPDIETDRPDQTETPYSVGTGRFQAENGYLISTIFKDLHLTNIVSLLRYGLTQKLELRAEIIRDKYVYNKTTINEGMQPLELGFKVNVIEEKGLLPKTSLIAHLALPRVASTDYKSRYYMPNFRFTMQHSLSSKQSLSYNLGGEWSVDDKSFMPLYTFASGYDFSKKLYGYIELFGFFPKGIQAEHSFDGGLAYLIAPNLQVDISAGFGITSSAPKHYTAIGLSFRLPK